jgi:transcriptional regulator GlxA family with amidase domain
VKPLDVTVLLVNGNYGSTALAPIEVFHSAGSLWNTLRNEEAVPRFRVTVASLDGRPVTTAYGVGLTPQVAISKIRHTDLVIVPASGLNLDAQLAANRKLFRWIRDWHARGAYVAGICSGAAFLAEAGLLDGRRATTHWGVADTFKERFPNVIWCPEVFVTEDRRILCSGGVYAAIDLSLYLVDKFCGHEIALKTAKSLLVDMPRTHQSGYAVLPVSAPHDDERIREAEAIIHSEFDRDLSIDVLARRSNMSPRTFIRRFKAATGRLPGDYLQTVRVSVAKQMLEDSVRSVQAVCSAVGYEDVAFFRSLFKRKTGMTPGEYRSKFRRTPPDLGRAAESS